MNARTADHVVAWFQEMGRMETSWDRGEPVHYCLCDHHAYPHAEGRRYRRYPDRIDGNTTGQYRARGTLRGLRVLHADLLRLLRATHHRQEERTVPNRGDVEFRQLFDRPQHRRHCIHRRGDSFPDLFGLRVECDRRRGKLLSFGIYVFAGASCGACWGHGPSFVGGDRHGYVAISQEAAEAY